MKKITIIISVLTILCYFVINTATAQTTKTTSKERVIYVGTSADYPPFEFYRRGKFTGFDIDLAYAIGKRLNRRVEIKDMPFPSLIPALKTHRIQAIFSAISSTEERKKSIAFSVSYHTPTFSFLYLKAHPVKHILQLKGQIVGAQTGSAMYRLGSYLNKQHQFKLKALDFMPALFKGLEANRFNVLIIETIQGKSFLKHSNKIAYSMVPVDKYPSSLQAGYAVGVVHNSALLPKINRAIKFLKEKGVIAKLKAKWLQ